MKTVARLSAEDRSDLFRNTANRMQMSDAYSFVSFRDNLYQSSKHFCITIASL